MTGDEFFAISEVAYLVERIPVARIVLQPTTMHVWFCQQAKATNMPLKEQCRVLDIPWHARKIVTDMVCPSLLQVARITPATVFAATLPEVAWGAEAWSSILIEAAGCPDGVRRWLAYNGVAIADQWSVAKAWIMGQEAIAMGTSVKKVVERAREHNEEVARATQERERQMLAPRQIEYDPQHDQYLIDGVRINRGAVNAGVIPYLGETATAIRERQRHAEDCAMQNYQAQLNNAMQQQPLGANAAYLNALHGLGLQAAPNGVFDGMGELVGQQLRIRLPNDYVVQQQIDNEPIAYAADLVEPLVIDGLSITVLNTRDQFHFEGKNMHHCVETYWAMAKRNGCFIVSMKRGNKHIATAEFNPDWQLVQAKGSANARVADDRKIMGAFTQFGEAKRNPKPKPVDVPEPARPNLKKRGFLGLIKAA